MYVFSIYRSTYISQKLTLEDTCTRNYLVEMHLGSGPSTAIPSLHWSPSDSARSGWQFGNKSHLLEPHFEDPCVQKENLGAVKLNPFPNIKFLTLPN